ncbi:MAG: Arginine-tRNA ligase [Candidatus Roizmanbacteria bacterium GW2011_GWA2_33_33]|uniref:arginine--tRNA ligase n=1 Tax=Candidatus Roizmanbacteria bacterium GW2011_GWA2_33_33 TaxID=1618476 RepID=A0A0G0D5I8_9BACT|nr:MAG: Arginine-tRNA ligase [Candidatus Roizmanbacteria bacterium GW2011_GWA2_33_33]
MIKDEILKNLAEALEKINVKDVVLTLEKPANTDFGDYSSSLPLKLTKQLKKNPMTISEEIVKNFPKNDSIKKIEIVKPGFINFWIADVQLINRLTEVVEKNFIYPEYYFGKNKKLMIEFAHPNTHKLFHIGHLRNISTGETLVRILEAVGNKVIRSNYEGDVGLHIAKCLYGIKNSEFIIQNSESLQKKIEFIGKMYSTGTKAYEDDPKAKEEILKINKMIYEKDPKIMPLWTETRAWSLEYFEENYKRFYSHFDRYYFESEFYKRGVESLGFPTYEGKELALAEKEFSDFGELDKIIHTVTPEQTSFFKVTFKVEELIDEKKYKNKQYHLAYEWVKLKAGKMSSREGNVIEANWLIDEVKKKISEKFNCDEETTEILAVASVKYSFLKNGTQTIIHFDIDESIAVDGNSAPYLIYTYVRCQSVLNKVKHNSQNSLNSLNSLIINTDESNVLRLINQFPEIVEQAAIQLAPNLIANYLYDLAQKYNYFYQKNKILESEETTKQFRLMLTQATGKVIKEGLYLLGIKTVEKM